MEVYLGNMNFEVYDDGNGFVTNGSFWQNISKEDIIKLKEMLNKIDFENLDKK